MSLLPAAITVVQSSPSALAIYDQARGLRPLVLPPAHRRLELLPPYFLGAISGSRDGGNHETDYLFRAARRNVHRLGGECNLGFELWRLQFDADCWRVHRSRLNRGSGRRIC